MIARRIKTGARCGTVARVPVAEVPRITGGCRTAIEQRGELHINTSASAAGCERETRIATTARLHHQRDTEGLRHVQRETARFHLSNDVDRDGVRATSNRCAAQPRTTVLVHLRIVDAQRFVRRKLHAEGQAAHTGDRHLQKVHVHTRTRIGEVGRQPEGDVARIRFTRRSIGWLQRTQGRVGRRGKTGGIDRAAGALRVYAA